MAIKKSFLRNEETKALIYFVLFAFSCGQMEKATASKLKR